MDRNHRRVRNFNDRCRIGSGNLGAHVRAEIGSHLQYLRLESGQSLPQYSGKAPFRAVVVVDEPVSNEWRHSVSEWLVESGCRYMMATGIDCSAWDDSVDWAALEKFDFRDISDKDFVMTTWHDDEPLSEVFWYAKHLAYDSAGRIQDTVVIHVSSLDREAAFVGLFTAA